MKRRKLLRASAPLVLGTAGVLGGIRVATSPARSVAVRARAPPDAPIDARGSVEEPFADEHPATLELFVTNRSSDHVTVYPANSWFPKPVYPVSLRTAVHGNADSSLLLYPQGNYGFGLHPEPVPPRRSASNCWCARETTVSYVEQDLIAPAWLPPGTELSESYTVLDGPDSCELLRATDCLERGTYRLSQPLEVGRFENVGERTGPWDDPDEEFVTTVDYVIELS